MDFEKANVAQKAHTRRVTANSTRSCGYPPVAACWVSVCAVTHFVFEGQSVFSGVGVGVFFGRRRRWREASISSNSGSGMRVNAMRMGA